MRLDRNRIVEAALVLLDEVGLDAFSTRALAERLGVRQPALYWHFAGRRALLDAMNERMLADTHEHRLPSEDEDWREFLLANARSFRRALLSEALQAHVRARLAPYEYPKEIEFIDQLPTTTTGKVQRRVLRLQEEERARAAGLV